MKKIAVLTSGGDAPGMNAAIRSAVRTAIYNGLEVVGVRRGFAGLIEGDFFLMESGSVSDIMQKGGTFLLSARCEEFLQPEGRKKAADQLKKHSIEGLVVIGGDGSLRGAESLYREQGIAYIAVPGTIDNDLPGTDYTIGFDTAMNTIIEAVNKIRDTATSHERTFIIETMGRTSGYLTIMAGLASGADAILIPENKADIEDVCQILIERQKQGRLHNIVLVAEGYKGNFRTNRDLSESNAFFIGKEIASRTGQDTRVIILGHLQRGGSPTAADRILASKLGARAVELLLEGKSSRMVGIIDNKIQDSSVEDILNGKKEINLDLYKLNEILSI